MVSAASPTLTRSPLNWVKQQEKKLPNFPNTHFQPRAGGLWQTAGHWMAGGFAAG